MDLLNNTNTIIILDDLGLSIPPNGTITVSNDYVYSFLNTTIKKISLLEISVVVDGKKLTSPDGLRYLASNTLEKIDIHGRKLVQTSTRPFETESYWTSISDDTSIVNDVGNGNSLFFDHVSGDESKSIKYFDFNTLENETYIKEGYIIWKNAIVGDRITFEIVSSKINYTSSTNTYYQLYDNLIIPASGNGSIELISDITQINPVNGTFVETSMDQFGNKQMAFWNADYNSTTHLFENIQATPSGDGNYNLFNTETVLSTFLNNINLLGSGTQRLASDDSTYLPFGARLRITAESTDINHDWQVVGCIFLYRSNNKKTYY